MIKHILSGGFVYLMIVNAFSWMNAVIKSFSAIGAAITGLPDLSPQSVLQARWTDGQHDLQYAGQHQRYEQS